MGGASYLAQQASIPQRVRLRNELPVPNLDGEAGWAALHQLELSRGREGEIRRKGGVESGEDVCKMLPSMV